MDIVNKRTTVWSDSHRSRYFLIPGEQALPPGDFAIRSGLSRQQKVDLAALLSYEISREEAKAWLDSQFENVLEKTKGVFPDSLKQALEGKPPSAESKGFMETQGPSPQPSPDSNENETALSFFSTLMREPADALRNDPEAVIRGMKKIGADITAILSNASSQSPDDLQTARTQFKSMLEILRSHGFSIGEHAHTLPDKLHDLSKSSTNSPKESPTRKQ